LLNIRSIFRHIEEEKYVSRSAYLRGHKTGDSFLMSMTGMAQLKL